MSTKVTLRHAEANRPGPGPGPGLPKVIGILNHHMTPALSSWALTCGARTMY